MVGWYGTIREAFVIMCKNGDSSFTWPKSNPLEPLDEFEYALPYYGWKKSRRGYWSCPTCVEKRKRKEAPDQGESE
jgi:hypothetical protein